MLYWLRKLSVDFWRFQVFVFYHRAYSKTRKPRKTSISSFFEVLRLFIWFWALFYAFCTFRTQFTKCCSKLSMSIYYYCFQWLFWLLKPKSCLGNKFVAFQLFSSNGNRYSNECFQFRKLSVYFWHFRVFAFCHRALFENTETTENFNKLIFRSVETIYLI